MHKDRNLVYPLFIPQEGCPYKCVYCNQHLITNSSGFNFTDAYKRLKYFTEKNKKNYFEIAYFGGTFTALSSQKQIEYLEFANQFLTQNSGIRISTRPDCINQEILNLLKKYRVNTIELGIQSFDDNVLTSSGRNYNVQTARNACSLISENNFNLGIQLMPGLPGYNITSKDKDIKNVVSLSPTFVRIYPTIVLDNTALKNIYIKGNYIPLSLEEAIEISSEMYETFEENSISVIKVGIHSDVSQNLSDVIAGPYHPAFGELVRGKILCDKIIKKWDKKYSKIFLSEKDKSLIFGHNKKFFKYLHHAINIDINIFEFDNQLNKNQIILK